MLFFLFLTALELTPAAAGDPRLHIVGPNDVLAVTAFEMGLLSAVLRTTVEGQEKARSAVRAGTGGIARPDRDPLLIPRNVVGDWNAERFEHWLDHWLTAS